MTLPWGPHGYVGGLIGFLRVTGGINRGEAGLSVLLTGRDEAEAARALETVPITQTGLSLTTTAVLCATSADSPA